MESTNQSLYDMQGLTSPPPEAVLPEPPEEDTVWQYALIPSWMQVALEREQSRSKDHTPPKQIYTLFDMHFSSPSEQSGITEGGTSQLAVLPFSTQTCPTRQGMEFQLPKEHKFLYVEVGESQ